jgi:glycosyltransferase involved in cell wall biosynthesis
MEAGGAERALATLLRFLDRSRFRPSLALLNRVGPFLAELPGDVAVHDLAARSGYNWLGPVRRLRRIIEADRPNVVIGVLPHPSLIAIVASRVTSAQPPVVVAAGTVLSRSLASSRVRIVKRLLQRRLYAKAAAIVAASEGVKADLVEWTAVPAERVAVIRNLCDLEHVARLAGEAPSLLVDWSRPTVAAVGRLQPVKAFDLLIEAFARIRRPAHCQLLILGEGPRRAELEQHVARSAVADRVHFLGFCPNPFAYVARAQVLAMSSAWEGSPNVLIEAMTCGTPIVAADCPYGPREVLQDGKAGLLVSPRSAAALAEGIERVLLDSALAARLSAAGRERARDFAAAAGAEAYAEVLQRAAGVSELRMGAVRAGP